MSKSEEYLLDDDDLPILQYRVWSLLDQKMTSGTILALTLILSGVVYLATDQVHLAVAAFLLLVVSAWRILVPMQFELTADGITRWTLGYHRFIAWSEIGSYGLQEEGVLILPHRRRYPLDAIRGIFIPIPKPYRPGVQRRLQYFVDKIERE